MKRLLVCLLLVGVVGCGKSESNKAISESNKAIGKPDKAEAELNKGVDVFDQSRIGLPLLLATTRRFE